MGQTHGSPPSFAEDGTRGPSRTPGRPVRILLADDQPLLRTGFRMVLGTEDDLDIVAEAGDGWRRWSCPAGCCPTWC